MAVKMMPDPPAAPPPPFYGYGLTQYDFLPTWMQKETDAYDYKYNDINTIISKPLYYPSTHLNTSFLQHDIHAAKNPTEETKQDKQEEIIIDPIDELLDF
jgi:hypothetical protein